MSPLSHAPQVRLAASVPPVFHAPPVRLVSLVGLVALVAPMWPVPSIWPVRPGLRVWPALVAAPLPKLPVPPVPMVGRLAWRLPRSTVQPLRCLVAPGRFAARQRLPLLQR